MGTFLYLFLVFLFERATANGDGVTLPRKTVNNFLIYWATTTITANTLVHIIQVWQRKEKETV